MNIVSAYSAYLGGAVLLGLGLCLSGFRVYRRLSLRAKALAALESMLGRMEGLEQAGGYEKAEAAANEALELLSRHFPEKSSQKAGPLKRIAGYFDRRQEPEKALEFLESAAAVLSGKARFGRARLVVDFELGLLKWKTADPEPAIRAMEGALARLSRKRSLKARLFLTHALNEISMVYRHDGRLEEADQALAKAVAVAEKNFPGSGDLIVYYANRAYLKETVGDFKAGLDELQKALTLALERSEVEETARIVERIQVIAPELTWPEQESFWRARRLELSQGPQEPELGEILTAALADCLFESGDYEQANRLLTPELAGRDFPPRLGRAFLLRARSRGLCQSFAYGEAVEKLQDALKIMEQKLGGQDEVVISTGLELAELYYDLGKPEPAVAVFHEAIAALTQGRDWLHPDLPQIYLRLMEIQLELGDYEEADRCGGQVLDLLPELDQEPELAARLLLYQAQALLHLDRALEAAPLLKNSIALSKQIEDPELEAAAWFYLSSSLQVSGDLDQALDCAKTAKETYSRAGVTEPAVWGGVYARLSSAYAANGDREQSMAFANQAMNLWVEEQNLARKTEEDNRELTLDDFFRPAE